MSDDTIQGKDGKAHIKGVADLIAESGLNPTEWEFGRLVEDINFIEECRMFTKAGKIPPCFDPTMRIVDAEKMVKELEADVLKEARTWRDYTLSRRKAVDVSGTIQAPVVRTATESDVDL